MKYQTLKRSIFAKISVFFIFFFSQLGFSSEYPSDNSENFNMIDTIHQEIGNLGEDKNYTFINLGISEEGLLLIDQLNVEVSKIYDQVGNLYCLKEELPNFLRSIGNNNEQVIEKITEVIVRIANDVTKACNKDTAWVSVRASTPHHGYDIPRWHYDGYYYTPREEIAYKFVMSLKGTHTLFSQIPQELREVFRVHAKDRAYLGSLLDPSQIETAKLGEGTFFIVGSLSCAASHSEPRVDSQRLFISIVPGNEDEIQEFDQDRRP